MSASGIDDSTLRDGAIPRAVIPGPVTISQLPCRAMPSPSPTGVEGNLSVRVQLTDSARPHPMRPIPLWSPGGEQMFDPMPNVGADGADGREVLPGGVVGSQVS